MGCEPAGYGFADLLKQGGGAFVALVGIVVTVAGLIGLKRYGSTGSLRQCTKGWKWTSSLAAWCVGQLLQLCAVELASEPVITAVSTLAVPANALLAWKILGEPVTRKERLAIVAITVGAGMVVVSSPQQARSAMTVRQEEALLTASVLPAIGLLVTLLAACLAGCAVWRSRRVGSATESLGFGALAGLSGATSISFAKLCWMLFDETTAGGENAFLQPASYLFGGVSALGEAGMAVALFFGLARGESTVVVPAYYISMNVMGSVQGLCLFDMFGCFTSVSGALFALGILLACCTVALMAAARRPAANSDRGTPLMEEAAPPVAAAHEPSSTLTGAYIG